MGIINKTNDGWDPKLYDGNFSFVSKYGIGLIDLLAPKKGEKILDLGCGTGDLTNAIYERDADILGVDKSENMVEQAAEKYPHIAFLVQDATQLEFDDEFDAVFSNAALHWIQPPFQVLGGIYRCLKKGGRFVAEFGGKGNVETITNEIIHQMKKAGFDIKKVKFPWYFPSIGEYSTLMEKAGFRVVFAWHYDRPTLLEGENGLGNWIRMFAGQMFHGFSEEEKIEIVNKVERNLKGKL